MGLRKSFFALNYNRFMASAEREGLADLRSKLVRQAAGDVLEIGAGTGLNLRHYSASVGALTLTEPDPAMQRRLERATRAAGSSATVLRAQAEDLPFDDASFDAVVCTLVLCGVDDQPRAARELRRVLRPGGRLIFLEHLRSEDEKVAAHQDRFNWLNRLVVMCECNRPTLRTLEQAGFEPTEVTHGEMPKAPAFVRPLAYGSLVAPVRTGSTPSEVSA